VRQKLKDVDFTPKVAHELGSQTFTFDGLNRYLLMCFLCKLRQTLVLVFSREGDAMDLMVTLVYVRKAAFANVCGYHIR
jgi:hypothetical protein